MMMPVVMMVVMPRCLRCADAAMRLVAMLALALKLKSDVLNAVL